MTCINVYGVDAVGVKYDEVRDGFACWTFRARDVGSELHDDAYRGKGFRHKKSAVPSLYDSELESVQFRRGKGFEVNQARTLIR